MTKYFTDVHIAVTKTAKTTRMVQLQLESIRNVMKNKDHLKLIIYFPISRMFKLHLRPVFLRR